MFVLFGHFCLLRYHNVCPRTLLNILFGLFYIFKVYSNAWFPSSSVSLLLFFHCLFLSRAF